MRGLPDIDDAAAGATGITPAHAGLTEPRQKCRGFFWDHPRACGAYVSTISPRNSSSGSPPRMRGLRDDINGITEYDGITPAHAGLTTRSNFALSDARDHPRACGAYITTVLTSPNSLGSPPRMRGLLIFSLSAWQPGGITPAHAGLTASSKTGTSFCGDHPRACGAYSNRSQ